MKKIVVCLSCGTLLVLLYICFTTFIGLPSLFLVHHGLFSCNMVQVARNCASGTLVIDGASIGITVLYYALSLSFAAALFAFINRCLEASGSLERYFLSLYRFYFGFILFVPFALNAAADFFGMPVLIAQLVTVVLALSLFVFISVLLKKVLPDSVADADRKLLFAKSSRNESDD